MQMTPEAVRLVMLAAQASDPALNRCHQSGPAARDPADGLPAD